jgi:hypothetical protein
MAKRKTATRTISNAGRLRVLRVVAAAKAVGLAPTESSVEADGLIDLEYDRTVERFEVQPLTVEVLVGGETRKYTPDVRYIRRTGVIGFREFKGSDEDLEPDTVRKLEAANERFRRDGYEFSVMDAAQLRVGYRMDNLRLLHRYARWPATQKLRSQVLGALEARPRQTLGDLRSLVGNAHLGGLYRMLWDQDVGVDLVSERLSACTAVWRAAA